MLDRTIHCLHLKEIVTWNEDVDLKHIDDGVIIRWGICKCTLKVREFYHEDYADSGSTVKWYGKGDSKK